MTKYNYSLHKAYDIIALLAIPMGAEMAGTIMDHINDIVGHEPDEREAAIGIVKELQELWNKE